MGAQAQFLRCGGLREGETRSTKTLSKYPTGSLSRHTNCLHTRSKRTYTKCSDHARGADNSAISAVNSSVSLRRVDCKDPIHPLQPRKRDASRTFPGLFPALKKYFFFLFYLCLMPREGSRLRARIREPSMPATTFLFRFPIASKSTAELRKKSRYRKWQTAISSRSYASLAHHSLVDRVPQFIHMVYKFSPHCRHDERIRGQASIAF